MKALVVYYSRSGITKKVAEDIAGILRCDIEEIIDKKNRKGIMGWLYSGRDALKKRLTEINDPQIDPAGYDVVVIGTPVWASNITPAIRTYIDMCKEKFKNIAVFCTSGGGDKRVLINLETLCSQKAVATSYSKMADVKSGAYLQKFKEFCSEIRDAIK